MISRILTSLSNISYIRYAILFLVIVSISINIRNSLEQENYLSFYYKDMATKYIVETSRGEEFSIRYNTPRGLDNGYNYLFWLNGGKIDPKSENFFIISVAQPLQKSEEFAKASQNLGVATKMESFGYIDVIYPSR